METLRDLFEHIVTYPPDKILMRARAGGRWTALTVGQFAEATRQVAAQLAHAGIAAGDRVALFSENRPHWHIIDFACHLRGAVLVPLYPTLPARQVRDLVADSGARLLLVSGADRARRPCRGSPTSPACG